jgi:RNA polymerase-binding transcription factor DksA
MLTAQKFLLEPIMKPSKSKGPLPKRPRRQTNATLTKCAAVGEILTGSPTSKPIQREWGWHFRVLMRLRERLLKDRGEQLAQVSEPLEPHSLDLADSATDEFDHDMALSQLSAGQDALFEVDAALKRILDGNYGVCEVTGQIIPAARLHAIPWTRFSKNVEEDLENKGAVERAHIGPAHSIRGPAPGGLAETEEPGEGPQEEKANEEALLNVYSPPGRHMKSGVGRKRGGATGARGGGKPC